MVLVVSEKDVRSLLTIEQGISIVEDSLRKQAEGRFQTAPRLDLSMTKGVFRVTAGHSLEERIVGLKALIPLKPHVQLFLFSAEDGGLQAVFGADWIGQVRTAATTAVATDRLARRDASRLAVIGTGKQALSQLRGIASVRRLSEVTVFSPNPEHRSAFLRLAASFEIPLSEATSVEEAISSADIVVTATTATQAFLGKNHLSSGIHVNSIGSNTPAKHEIQEEAISAFDRVVVDSIEQARSVSGDLIAAVKAGHGDWGRLSELGNIIIGKERGRMGEAERTIFKSHGLVSGDVALAHSLLQSAAKSGAGMQIQL